MSTRSAFSRRISIMSPGSPIIPIRMLRLRSWKRRCARWLSANSIVTLCRDRSYGQYPRRACCGEMQSKRLLRRRRVPCRLRSRSPWPRRHRATSCPPSHVEWTRIDRRVSGETVVGSRSRTTRSADLPTSRLPQVSSRWHCQAASMVTARMASRGEMHSAGFKMPPPSFMSRRTAFSIHRRGSMGVTL